mgnify:CR=1 FL=1
MAETPAESRTLGRYELLAELGKGAMGVVYRANDPLLGRLVAIKTVNMSLDPQEMAEYEGRFYQEAKAAGSLNHPNIVTIYDVGKSGNLAYMAMEFLQGEELRSLLTSGQPLPVGRAVDIAAQVAEGLAYAHQHGVVHRDVKPGNILIDKAGGARLADLGLAVAEDDPSITGTGGTLGTPHYISPEQAVDPRKAAQRIDLRPGDIILGVDGADAAVSSFMRVLKGLDAGGSVSLDIARDQVLIKKTLARPGSGRRFSNRSCGACRNFWNDLTICAVKCWVP